MTSGPANGDEKDGTNANATSWEDRLAQKYYESLYREFAVCDLKHYKSGNVSPRLLAPPFLPATLLSLSYTYTSVLRTEK